MCSANIRCKALRIDSIFRDDDWSVRALSDYQSVLAGRLSPQEAIERWDREDPSGCYGEGFYYTKTSLVK